MGVWLVGVDTGGTFTDLIAVEQTTGELRRAKVPSVSGDPSAAVLDAMDKLFADGINPADISLFVHGTTVATNALLEGKGVRTGLLITRGFRAVYEARGWSQPRGSDLLDTFYQKPPLLAPQWLTEEVRERLDYRGEVVTPLDEAGLRDSVHRLKAKGVEALAVCFLFSFLNPDHERRAAEIVAEVAPECRISLSSNVLPVIREYPRLSTTVIDAYVGPTIADYLMRLERRLIERGLKTPQLFLMQSNGGLMRISLGRAPSQPDAAVGARGRRDRRRRIGARHASASCHHLRHGRHLDRHQRHRRGAAAGDHAGPDRGPGHRHADAARAHARGGRRDHRLDRQGRLLKVGPRSAGSVPGPACYGRGGEEPTVTDANVALGALSGDTVLAGSLRLDAGRAARAIETVAKPLGLDVLQGAAGHPAHRQHPDGGGPAPRLAGAGAGSPQVCARGLRRRGTAACGRARPQRRAFPPCSFRPIPGSTAPSACCRPACATPISSPRSACSAVSRPARMNDLFRELREQALAEASEEGFAHEAVKLTRLLDLRYPHQGYTLPVACPADIADADKARLKQAFDEVHLQVYGQSAPREDAEIVTFRLQAEIEVPRLELPALAHGDGRAERALKGERPLFDIDDNRFVRAAVYDRQALMAGDRIAGPAIIDQFDATTVVLGGQTATVDDTATLIIQTGDQP